MKNIKEEAANRNTFQPNLIIDEQSKAKKSDKLKETNKTVPKLVLKNSDEKEKKSAKVRPVTAPQLSNRSTESEKVRKKMRPKTAPPPDKKVGRQYNVDI